MASAADSGDNDDLFKFMRADIEDEKFYKALECHLNWLDPSPETLEKLIEHDRRWVEDTKDDPLIPVSQKLTHQIMNAIFAHKADDFEKASGYMELGAALLEEVEDNEVKKAYELLIQANINVLKYWENDLVNAKALKEITIQLGLECSQSRKATAATLAMKSYCFGLKGDCSARLGMYQKVIELDPGVPEYLDSYFKALRKVRREKSFLSPPTDQEIELIEEAYRLAPKSARILRSLCTVYHDTLKARNHDFSFTNKLLGQGNVEEFVLQMKQMARDAAAANPFSVVIAIRLAEILSYARDGQKNSNEDILECEAHFEKCLDTWPNNSEVLHKAGKFYCSNDTSKGLKYLAKSIQVDGENYPALMDYLRVSYRCNKSGVSKLLDLVENTIPNLSHKKEWLANLLCLKAVLLVKKNSCEAALNAWLEAIRGEPELVKNRHTFLGRGTFPGLLGRLDFQNILDFVKNEIDEEPLDSVRLTPLKGIEEAISAELELFGTSRAYSVIRKHTFSESEQDSDWRSPTCRSNSGLSSLESSSTTSLSTSATSPSSFASTPSVGVYKCPSRDTNGTPSIGWGFAGGQKRNDRMARSYDHEPIVTPEWREFETNGNRGRQARRNFGLQDNLPDSLTTPRDSPNYWNNGSSGSRAEFGTRTQENTNRRPRSSYEAQLSDLDDNWRR